MSSENDPELTKKAMMDKRAKIKSLKDKMRANKNPTKEIEKIEDIEEKENKEEKIEKENNENNSKNILDELIKFDEENNKDEILNDKMENRSNESSNDDNKEDNKDENNIINIKGKNEEINIEIKNNNINENINDNITNTNIDDSNKNINIIEGNKLEFSSRSHSGSKISNKKEEKDDEIYSEKEEKEKKEEKEEKVEINLISSDKKEKEEINIVSSDKKEEKKNNIKKEIKDINEKKTKSKILIKKVKPSNNNIENNPKENIISITEPTSNNNNKTKKKKEINSNFLHKNTTIVTKIQRNPNKILKKSMTTYTNKLAKKKFDPVKFNEYLKGVNDYENRKKEKIEHMKKQEEEKELKKITYHPKINKESNLKFKVNPKNYSTVERLYTQDLMKRKEKKQILSKIYAPTFKPKLYTNKHVINKTNQRNQNIKTEIYESENNLIFEDNEDFEEKNNFEEEERRNNSVKKRMKDKKIEDEGEIVPDDSKIENKLRSLLFKNKKGTGKRNKSVEKRKKTNFNLD